MSHDAAMDARIPARDALQLEEVLHALSDPVRRTNEATSFVPVRIFSTRRIRAFGKILDDYSDYDTAPTAWQLRREVLRPSPFPPSCPSP